MSEIDEQQEQQPIDETEDSAEAAFNEFAAARDGEDQDFDDEPEQEPETEQAPAADTKPAVPRDVLDDLDADALRHRLRSDAGRIGALQRKINELERQQKVPPVEPPKPPASLKEWEEMKEDYPEIAAGIEKFIQSRLAPLDAVSRKMGRYEQDAQQRQREAEIETLRQAHPDFAEIAASQEFSDWTARQPVSVQALRGSQSSSDAVWMLDQYKRDQADARAKSAPAQQLKQKRMKTLATAQETPTHRRVPVVADETDYETSFEHFARQRER